MTSAMRRLTIPLALAICGGLISACAGNHAAVVRIGETASGPPGRPAALGFARAVNLTAADVPGFSVSSKQEGATAAEQRLERQMLACVGPVGSAGSAARTHSVADVGSKSFEFKHGIVDLGVSSEVSVSSSPALAASELAAIRSSRVRGCFSHYLNLLFRSAQYAGASVAGVSIASGTPPAPGTNGGFGWRITARLRTHGAELPLYMDVLGFVDGPSRVTLFSSGALEPFPAAAEERLFTLLLDRAKARPL